MDLQITCITSDGSDEDRKIDAVGGPGFSVLPIATAIAWHDQGHTFWTKAGLLQLRAEVYVRGTLLTGRFMTTSPDGYLPNNLHRLPQCA